MYESIKGVLTYLTPEFAVIEVNDIGYKIYIPINLFTTALHIGKKCELFTSLVVREDDMKLFGFISRKDRDLFELLISISKVGAKTSLSIIGHMSLDELYNAIETKNDTMLCKIPGIGKKSAERLIVELKGRIKPDAATKVPKNFNHDVIEDATCALITLGYNQKIAEQAIKKAMASTKEENIALPKLITAALKNV